jgi:hypothetical protein
LLGLHEAQAEAGPHHYIADKADHSHQDDVAEEHALGLFPDAGDSMPRRIKGVMFQKGLMTNTDK